MPLDYHTPPPAPRLSTLAVMAFAFGLVAPPGGFFIITHLRVGALQLPLLIGPIIAACVLGFVALWRVDASGGAMKGHGLALAGALAGIAWGAVAIFSGG